MRIAGIPRRPSSWIRTIRGALVLGLMLFGPLALGASMQAAFSDQTSSVGNNLATSYWAQTVNSTRDLADAVIGDGICDTGEFNSALAPECTLRAAIEEANVRPGNQVIDFAMPAGEPGFNSGVWTISPEAEMPTITNTMRIDGSTQLGHSPNTAPAPAGLNGTLVVEIRPTSQVRIFTIDASADSVEMHGLVVNGHGGILFNGPDLKITGSYLGSDPSGMVARPGGNNVATIFGQGALIGGTQPEDRNLISGHGSALYVAAPNVVVQGNLIGSDATGVVSIGTQSTKILARAANTLIGGIEPGASNVITGPGTGVVVDGGTGTSILGNVIFGNTDFVTSGVGIDLSPVNAFDGVSANDPGDVDSGPNDMLNFPEITSTADIGNDVSIDYILDVPAGTYRVEFFTNPSGVDPTGHGEGQFLLGADTIIHTGAGPETFNAVFSGTASDIITATTTEDLGNGDFGSTSEFSAGAFNIVTVNSTGDLGDLSPGDSLCDTGGVNADGNPECTMRAAIEEANASAPIDTVLFAIPTTDAGHSAGTWTISPSQAHPAITQAVTIDGTSQPGFVHNTNPAPLGINWNQVIMIDGTNAGGTSDGFLVQADDVNLSGFTLGNFHWAGGYGIELAGDRVTITEMAIGTDLTGQIRQPVAYGIWSTGNDVVIGGSNPQDRNLITGADNGQVSMSPSVNVLIDGNLIGTNVDATSLLVEWNTGIEAWSGANIQIGTMDAGNVIGAWWGIETGADDVTIENNLIGTNAAHDADLGGWQAILAWNTTVIRANTIGNFDEGIEVARVGNRIEGNWIGTDQTETIDLGMTTFGIGLSRSALDTTIGGTDPSQSNVIAKNGTTGIQASATTDKTAIIGNSIYGNGGLGIDLGIDGVTVNDPGDSDVGTNNLLNHPEITGAGEVAGSVTVDYLLDVPAGLYRIEAFVNSSGADSSGFGEGETIVAATTVVHSGAGNESFQLSYSGAAGDIVTMTATHETPGPSYDFTSEFSAIHTVD